MPLVLLLPDRSLAMVIEASLQIVVVFPALTEILPATGMSCTLTIVEPVKSIAAAEQLLPSTSSKRVYFMLAVGDTF